jgi:hypothetical protein
VEHEAQAVDAGDTWIAVEERKGRTPHRLMRDAEALVCMVWLHGLAHQVLRVSDTLRSKQSCPATGLPSLPLSPGFSALELL